MSEWSLIKKIKSLNLTEKVFDWDDLPKSLKHEGQIEFFQNELESRGLEIFEIRGHQFMTEDGIYTIAHSDEIEYGGE